jgi:hypothetical protein
MQGAVGRDFQWVVAAWPRGRRKLLKLHIKLDHSRIPSPIMYFENIIAPHHLRPDPGDIRASHQNKRLARRH